MEFEKLIDTMGSPTGKSPKGDPLYPPKRKAPVSYTSRKNSGRATVVNGYEGETGPWVTLYDKQRDVNVVVRPSQVSA